MKIVYVADVHIWHTTPRKRVDNYKQSCLNMLQKVVQFCNETSADLLLFGGDLGHNTDWPISLFHDVHTILSACNCPVISAIGNHDIDSYNLSTVFTGGLGALELSKALTIGQESIEFKDTTLHFFNVISQPAEAQLDRFQVIPTTGKLNIGVAHAPIEEKHYPALTIKGLDYLFLADIHKNTVPYQSGNCLVVNPGPLERRSINEKDEGGIIAVLDEKNLYYVDLGVPVGDSVFITKADQDINCLYPEIGITTLEVINSAKFSQDESADNIIRKLGEELGYQPEIIDYCVDQLENDY